MRQTVAVKGARENNLQNIELEIPRDQLVVVTVSAVRVNLHWHFILFMQKDSADSSNRCLRTLNALLHNSKSRTLISLTVCPLLFLLNRKRLR